MFFLTSGNEQVDEIAWSVMEAARRGNNAAVIAALPRMRMALADLPLDATKKAEVMAEYDKAEAELRDHMTIEALK